MRLSGDQLAILSRLSDEWLDLPEGQRIEWRYKACRQYPSLSLAISAIADDFTGLGTSPQLQHTFTEREIDEHAFVAGDLIGPYQLLRQIGAGGMGVVWLAQQADGQIARTVALKLPLQTFAERGPRARFVRERNILAALDHPNIAKILDAGVTADGQPYMAMPYVDGKAITVHCDLHQLDVVARVKLFIELLNAVQYAHSNLIVHRDLKPSNILVATDGNVMLLDFGIAKLLDTSLSGASSESGAPMTQFEGIALTLDYASPEQVAGQPVATQTDIYSSGVVLYELLVGKRPYRLRRATRAAVEEAVLEQEIKVPSSRVDETASRRCNLNRRALGNALRGDLDAIVLKALRKSANDRYSTTQAFADDLQCWLEKKPVSAQPDKLGYRVRRLFARQWRLIAASSVAALILIVMTATALVQAIDAKHSSQVAIDESRKAKAIASFLTDIFKMNGADQADPATARSRTAEQLLDVGAKRIQTSLLDAPGQQIELLRLMALMYLEMRLPDRAVELAEQAIVVAKKAYGADDPRTLAEVANLATWAFSHNLPERGSRALELVLPEFDRLAGSDDIAIRRVAGRVIDAKLADELFNHVHAALPTARRAARLYLTFPLAEYDSGRHHLLAVANFKNFEFSEAEQHFSESERIQLSRGNLSAASYPGWYSQLLALTGRYIEAETKFESALAMERHSDADGARIEDWVIYHFAKFLMNTSRYAEALELSQTGGNGARIDLRKKLQVSMRSLWAKGEALVCIGRVEEGLETLDKADVVAKAKWGDLATSVLPYGRILAMLEVGDLDGATSQLDATEKILKELDAQASTDSRLYWRYRLSLLIARKKTAEAREMLNHARPFLSPLGAGLSQLAMTDWLEAAVEQQEAKHSTARRRLEARLAQISDSPDRLWLREWEARLLESLGVSLVAQGENNAAQVSFEKAVEIYKEILDPKTSLSVGRVYVRLAEVQLQAAQLKKSRLFLAQADAIRRKHSKFVQWVF